MRLNLGSWIFYFMLSSTGFAQQNFFNVPSSDITEKNKFFFQQQINLTSKNTISNSTLSYGLGQGVEVGLNILGVTYDYNSNSFISSLKTEEPLYPSMGINSQKQFKISNSYSISAGGQVLLPKEIYDTEWYLYLNHKLELKHFKLVAGLYTGDDYYFDTETRFNNKISSFGLQFGTEVEIIQEKLFFQADYLSGRTVLSNLITGFAAKFRKNLVLSAGYQIPNYRITSTNCLVLEITILPK